MKRIALIATVLLMGTAAVPAAAQQVNNQAIIENFDGPQLGQLLNGMNAKWEMRTNESGEPFYSIQFGNGANALAIPSVCGGAQPYTGCQGLKLMARFSKPQTMTPGAVAARVNQYNTGHAATMVTYDQQGGSQLNMYVIADYGITVGNLGMNLAVFQSATASYSQLLYNNGQPPAQQAPAAR